MLEETDGTATPADVPIPFGQTVSHCQHNAVRWGVADSNKSLLLS